MGSVLDSDQQYLVFKLVDFNYSIPIKSVKEVIEPPDFQSIPNSVDSFVGLFSHQNKVYGCFDLALRFGIRDEKKLGQAILIVGEAEDQYGLCIDKLIKVAEPHVDDIKNDLQIECDFPKQYIEGVLNNGEEYIPILNTKKLLETKELNILKNIEQSL